VNGAVNGAAPLEPTQAAAAAPPSSAGEPTTRAPGGAAPLTADELRALPESQRTPQQKRRLSMLERKAKADAARAKRLAKKSAPAAAAPAAKDDDDELDEDERDDAQRERETGGFWRLTLRVMSLLLWPFGWRLEPLSDKECAEDVALLAPLARRHAWLDVLVRYAALPYLLVERVVSKAKRREPEKPPASPPPKGGK
jgi:hypothetical protein